MARLFTCADVLEQLEGDVSSGDDRDSRIPATSFMPDADELSGTGTEDMDLDASTMDQDGERPREGSLCDSGK